MAPAPPATYKLPPNLITPPLIATLLKSWFGNTPPRAKNPTPESYATWFGRGKSAAERAAFDEHLRTTFGDALAALSPAKLALPPFQSVAEDRRNAALLVRPFRRLPMLKKAGDASADAGAGTENYSYSEDERARAGLGIVLLLDQLPRNIWRAEHEKGVVFAHYDRLALAFVHCVLNGRGTAALDAEADGDVGAAVQEDGEEEELADLAGLHLAPALRDSWPWRSWFYLPYMHSEDLDDHDAYSVAVEGFVADMEARGDEESTLFARNDLDFEARHRVIIERFGRYPHRNVCLGRASTEEERKFLEGGGDTFAA